MLSITKHILIIFLVLGTINATSQEDAKPSQHALKMDFKLPTAFGNGAFKAVMNGLVDLDFAYQYHFEKSNLIANSGIKYGLWNVETTFFAGTLIEGQLQTFSPFIGLGYRNIITERVFMDLEVKAGYAMVQTKAIKCSQNHVDYGISFEPKFNIYLQATDMLYFGANINYNFIGAEFSEDNLCIADFPGLSNDSSQGSYSYFSIGLGFYAFLPKSK